MRLLCIGQCNERIGLCGLGTMLNSSDLFVHDGLALCHQVMRGIMGNFLSLRFKNKLTYRELQNLFYF